MVKHREAQRGARLLLWDGQVFFQRRETWKWEPQVLALLLRSLPSAQVMPHPLSGAVMLLRAVGGVDEVMSARAGTLGPGT